MPFDATIDSLEALRERYAEPHDLVRRKQIDRVDDAARQFLARTSLVVMATSGRDGADASPRGGPPGFVRVLDERRIAFGDLSGNRRLDSLENLVMNPEVGLLCIVPGLDETLRINGRASLTTDPAVLAACALDDLTPAVAVGIDVAAVYLHCAKAFRRAGAWDPDAWLPPAERPRPSAIFKAHLDLSATAEQIDADLEAGYQASMWVAGGRD